jgi:hypothetical protein
MSDSPLLRPPRSPEDLVRVLDRAERQLWLSWALELAERLSDAIDADPRQPAPPSSHF